MSELPFSLWERIKTYKVYLIGGGVGFLLLILVLGLSLMRTSKKQPISIVPTPTPKTLETATSPKTSQPQSPPEVFFETYQNRAGMPVVPASVNTYTFKTNYTLEEALSFGKKLGLTEYKKDGDWVVLYNVADKDKRGLLSFHKPTGSFSYTSWTVTRGPTASTNPKIVAQTFLASLGIADDTVSCNITYQKKDLPNTTFVECHRDWEKTGLPILGYPGVLNVPEGKPLSKLALGGVDENTPQDENIVNVSGVFTGKKSTENMNLDGRIRPNDFNTATVAVSSDGRILSVDSNLRKIVKSDSINTDPSTSSGLWLTPQQALNQFLSHNSQLSLTIPAGSGSVDWNKVYPNNKAKAKKAIITDYLLTYLEKPGQVPQDNLVPMYLIRGIAELESGFTVRFTETVPALANQLSFLSPIGGVVAGRSIKLGTFTPAPMESTQPTMSPYPSLLPKCEQAYTGYIADVTLKIPGLGEMIVLVGGRTTGQHSFFFSSASFPVSTIEEVRDVFFQAVEEQYVITVSHWLKDNPQILSSMPINSVNDVYKIFKKSIGCLINILVPGSPCVSQWSSDMDRIRKVSENVSDRILEIIQKNEISFWANKADLFPKIVLDYFDSVFANGLAYNPSLFSEKTCYIAGISPASPALFLYPPTPIKVTIKLASPVTYADPPFSTTLHTVPACLAGRRAGRQGTVEKRVWKVTAYPNSDLRFKIHDLRMERNRLYYEYDKSKVSFTEPKEGFVVKYDEWEKFIRGFLSPQLGLNKKEMEALVAEVRNALRNFDFSVTHLGGAEVAASSPSEVSFRYLKISFVESKELDRKLPVETSHKPDNFYRIHLMLTPLNHNQKIDEPVMILLTRNGFTVIELGAVTQ